MYNKGLVFRKRADLEEKYTVKINNYEEARKAFEKVIDLDPDYPHAWYNKGLTLRDLKKHDEALKAFEQVKKLDPDYPHAWYNKGLTLRDLKEHDEALKAFEKVIDLDPDYPHAWYNKGILLREGADEEKEYRVKIDKYDKALEAFEKARLNSEVFYNKAIVYYNKGLAFLDIGKHDEAINNFDDAIKNLDKIPRDPKEPLDYLNVLNFKGYILIQYNKYPKYREAISLYNVLFKDAFFQKWGNKYLAYNNIGLVYSCIGDYKNAIDYFKKAFKGNQKDSYALYSKGYAYEKAGDFETALKAYLDSITLAEALALASNDLTSNDLTSQDLAKAIAFSYLVPNDLISEDLAKAIAKAIGFNHLASKDLTSKRKRPQNTLIDAYYYTGLACYNRGLKPKSTDINYLQNSSSLVIESELRSIDDKKDINKLKQLYFRIALKYFERALEEDPCNINLWIHEAKTLYELNSYKEAIDCLKEAIKINSNNGLLYTVISNIYLDVGNLDDASKNINKALVMGYKSSVIWKLRGLIHIEKKEYYKAIYCLEKAILLNAENDDFIDPLLLIWKAYAKYLEIEFSSISKDNIKYMKCIYSIIRDLDRTFLDGKEFIGVCSIYFIGCFYYKINDVYSAKRQLEKCIEHCKKLKNSDKISTPELHEVQTSASELLDYIWTYQIRPPWWKWWLGSPVYTRKRQCTFIVLSAFISLLLLGPVLCSVYINWTIYLEAILFFTFTLLFPSLESIKGKDFEIKINSPKEFKFELYPVTPPKKPSSSEWNATPK